MREDERTIFREVHEDLLTAVRVHEPLKRDETRSFCSPTCAAMVLSCIWQAEIHCCDLQCPKASLGHGHVSIGAAEWPQQPRLPLCLGARRSRQRILASILALRYGIRHGSCKRSLVGRAVLDRHTLRRAAEEMKQIQRAAKAAKLAQGLTAIRKRKRRTQGKRKTRQRPLAASAAQDISDAEWASDSDFLTEDAEDARKPWERQHICASRSSRQAAETVSSHPMWTLPNNSSNYPCFRSDRLGSYLRAILRSGQHFVLQEGSEPW